jgi:hypothetical protein
MVLDLVVVLVASKIVIFAVVIIVSGAWAVVQLAKGRDRS